MFVYSIMYTTFFSSALWSGHCLLLTMSWSRLMHTRLHTHSLSYFLQFFLLKVHGSRWKPKRRQVSCQNEELNTLLICRSVLVPSSFSFISAHHPICSPPLCPSISNLFLNLSSFFAGTADSVPLSAGRKAAAQPHLLWNDPNYTVWKSEIINSHDLRPGPQLPADEVAAAGQAEPPNDAWRTSAFIGLQDRSLTRENKYPAADRNNRILKTQKGSPAHSREEKKKKPNNLQTHSQSQFGPASGLAVSVCGGRVLNDD